MLKFPDCMTDIQKQHHLLLQYPPAQPRGSQLIRRYEPCFREAAIELGRSMHMESRFRELEFSENKVLQLLERPNVFGAFSLTGNCITGFFLGVVQPMWFSEARFGFDLALYMRPEYRQRRTPDAVRLIREFEKFCAEQGCSEINLGSTAEISTESAKRLYAKLGYKECGFISRKEL